MRHPKSQTHLEGSATRRIASGQPLADGGARAFRPDLSSYIPKARKDRHIPVPQKAT